jgi:hypothetical protein
MTTSLAFGNVTVGHGLTKNVTVRNTGSAKQLTISIAISSDPAEFAVSDGGTCGAVPVTLAPKKSCTMRVTFTPNAPGAHSATLTLNDNVVTSPQRVVLKGTGMGPRLSRASDFEEHPGI